MAAILDGGRLHLSGYVGAEYFEDGFTVADVVMALASVGEDADLDVYINSYGGGAAEGSAIHAVLSRRRGHTNIVVDGIAASSASLIAMAGDTVTMSAGSVMMIHEPARFVYGPAAELLKVINELEKFSASYARLYADKSGKSVEDCRAIMQAETWFTAEEAVESGFADAIGNAKSAPVAAFDYRVFAHAPSRLVALAKSKKWSIEAKSTRHIKEPSMTDKPNGGDDAAELARLRAENAEMKKAAADRERRDAVLALPEAKGCEPLAQILADSGLTADQARAALAAAGTSADSSDKGELPSPQAYERHRAAAAGMGGGWTPNKGDVGPLSAAVARINKRR